MQHPAQAQRVVDLAKDTVQYLDHLNSTTNLYRRNQVFYNQFLASAIAVVFLASVHAPVRFSPVCREEFYMALDLVKDLSAKSSVSQRLWRTIKSLKDVAPRFGLNPDDDAHSSAALGMIGLARGQGFDGGTGADNGNSGNQTTSFPVAQAATPSQAEQVDQNGNMIRNELSRIFEGYVGLNGFQYGDQPVSDIGAEPSLFAGDGTVYSHLREMF